MDRLIEGYRRFKTQRWLYQRELYAELADNHRPRVMVIACCDSRVDPATIFDGRPGEIFVIRNVANLVPPFHQGEGLHGTGAAIEFGITQLKVSTVLVMGHARCGGIAAALAPQLPEGTTFLADWIALIDPALRERARAEADPGTRLERESIRVSLQRLMTYPCIAEAVDRGELRLAGARFGIADGELEILDPASGRFIAVGDQRS